MKNWKKVREIKGKDGLMEWDNTKSNTTIKVRWRKDWRDNFVSILGRGRYQPEYLIGGNSRIHGASKTKAIEVAKEWMREHPYG